MEYQSSLSSIEQYAREHYGKATVSGLAMRSHTQGAGVKSCYFGTCDCPIVSWLYLWECWCTDGDVRATWELAMLALERHMDKGYHK